MTMLAERLPAPEAHRWGLVDHVVDDSEVLAGASDLVARLAKGPMLAHAATKRLLNAAMLPALAEHLLRETDAQADLAASSDYQEGVAAFTERRAPTFRG